MYKIVIIKMHTDQNVGGEVDSQEEHGTTQNIQQTKTDNFF